MAQTLDEVARGRIKAWINSTGVTQTLLAERIGKNQAWMSRYLSAEFDADLETLQKIAKVFGHNLTALLDAPTDPNEATLIEAYRAMHADDRALGLALFQKLSRPRRRARAE